MRAETTPKIEDFCRELAELLLKHEAGVERGEFPIVIDGQYFYVRPFVTLWDGSGRAMKYDMTYSRRMPGKYVTVERKHPSGAEGVKLPVVG